MARELRVPADGAFASSLDADTEGEEGATYTWTAAEVRALIGPDAALVEEAYDVTDEGNWEGRTILRRVADATQVAAGSGATPGEIEERLGTARARLLEVRDRRPQPGRDDKVLTSWNGLAIAAFADAGRALGEDRFTRIATEAADFILRELRTPEGRLLRSWKDGRAQHAGVLEDHAHLADGLLALYGATFEERWFVAARELIDVVLARFEDPGGGFHDTADDAEPLIARPRGLQDNALPSGGAMATHVILRLSALTGDGRYRDAAERALLPMSPLLARHPTAFAMWLQAQQLASGSVAEVAIVGDPAGPSTRALVTNSIRRPGLPTRRRRIGRTQPERHPAPPRSGRPRRRTDRLCLPIVRMPAPRHDSRRPGGPAQGSGVTEAPAPSAVLFDLDGTLVDTVGTRARAWMEVFDALGIGYDETQIGGLMGADGTRVAREVAEAAGRTIDDAEALEIDHLAGAAFSRLNADPDAAPWRRGPPGRPRRAGDPVGDRDLEPARPGPGVDRRAQAPEAADGHGRQPRRSRQACTRPASRGRGAGRDGPGDDLVHRRLALGHAGRGRRGHGPARGRDGRHRRGDAARIRRSAHVSGPQGPEGRPRPKRLTSLGPYEAELKVPCISE